MNWSVQSEKIQKQKQDEDTQKQWIEHTQRQQQRNYKKTRLKKQ